jgi:hypothetical protein
VVRLDRADGDATHRDLIADRHLPDVAEPRTAQPPTGPGRHDDRRVSPERAERWHVQVVPVKVRDQDRVDPARPVARRHGLDPPKRAHPAARDRVRQQADPVELDDDRRVTEELEAQRAGQRQPLRAASG